MTTRRVRRLLAEMAAEKAKYPDHWIWKEVDVSPNRRVPVYSEMNKLLGRPLTPDERNRLDRLLDSMDAPHR